MRLDREVYATRACCCKHEHAKKPLHAHNGVALISRLIIRGPFKQLTILRIQPYRIFYVWQIKRKKYNASCSFTVDNRMGLVVRHLPSRFLVSRYDIFFINASEDLRLPSFLDTFICLG